MLQGVVVQLVRIPACHAGGRGFESRPLRQPHNDKSGPGAPFFLGRIPGTAASASALPSNLVPDCDVPTADTPPSPRIDAAVATLAVEDLGCRRGNRLLFKGVSFTLAAGQARWLRGRNGCGKTSLLRIAAGLAPAANGRVTFGGTALRIAPGYARCMSYIGHANALKDDLTVTEALQFLARLQGRPADRAHVYRALDRLGLADRHGALVRTLSQGLRRRAALARLAFEAPPALWILDEPYDALDADGIERLNVLLHEHLVRGGSVLLTSHQSPGAGAPSMTEFDLGGSA